MTPTAHIVLSVYNGALWVEEQIRSVQAQSVDDWRLFVRDDGSTDDTVERVRAMAEADPRIHLHAPDGANLGATLCYSWLLERVPAKATRVFCCDADDVWTPQKIERSLEAMDHAEAEAAGPVLVHTDMSVVDEALRPVAPSFWGYAGLDVDADEVRRVLVRNVATGPTLLLNRALLERAVPIPAASPHHDWWIALVAAATGRIVALPDRTVLYRRHGANVTAAPGGGARGLREAASGARAAEARGRGVRWGVEAASGQARAFLDRFGAELSPADARAARDVASLARRGPLGRKLGALRYWGPGERGLLRNLALLLRA